MVKVCLCEGWRYQVTASNTAMTASLFSHLLSIRGAKFITHFSAWRWNIDTNRNGVLELHRDVIQSKTDCQQLGVPAHSLFTAAFLWLNHLVLINVKVLLFPLPTTFTVPFCYHCHFLIIYLNFAFVFRINKTTQ